MILAVSHLNMLHLHSKISYHLLSIAGILFLTFNQIAIALPLVDSQPQSPSVVKTTVIHYIAVRPLVRRLLIVQNMFGLPDRFSGDPKFPTLFENVLFVYDMDTLELKFTRALGLNGLAFALDDMAVLAGPHHLEIVNLKSGSSTFQQELNGDPLELICSPKNAICAVTLRTELLTLDTGTKTIKRWSVVSDRDRVREFFKFRLHGSPLWNPRDLTISEDGTRIAVKRDDGEIQVWSAGGSLLSVEYETTHKEGFLTFDSANKLLRKSKLDRNASLTDELQQSRLIYGRVTTNMLRDGQYCFVLRADGSSLNPNSSQYLGPPESMLPVRVEHCDRNGVSQ